MKKFHRIKNICNCIKANLCSNSNELSTTDYSPLCPTDEAKDVEMYTEALSWALSLKSKIRNIAISGPYGSGKSSILQTFIKDNKEKHKFLNISLATFKGDDNMAETSLDYQNPKPDIDDEKLQRLIELSILQQIIYREKSGETPESQFKKTSKRSYGLTTVNFIMLLLLILSSLHLFAPSILERISLFDFFNNAKDFYRLILSIVFCCAFGWLAYRLFAFIMGSYVKKITLPSTEIELDKGVSKSILNKHIDEIIYFFEETMYDVVIIEDLDRFGKSDIFTKLREINQLINSSRRIKQDVVFIYAIKDDMFLDKERVKFFDFMIPIVPIINFSTSGEILRKKEIIKTAEISEDLIDNLSIFIDDMRLLNNILNEFIIYDKIANAELYRNNLLAIVIYKNLYPSDFANLGYNNGYIYGVISQKAKYIADAKDKIDADITRLKVTIQESEEQMFDSLTELRILYIVKAIESNTSFVTFIVNKRDVKLYDIANNDDLFKLFETSQLNHRYKYDSYNVRTGVFKVDFKAIGRLVNPRITYSDREKRIRNKPNLNDLKKQVEDLTNDKNEVQKRSLRELISSDKIILNGENEKQKQLISILLQNGYIDENYLDYISVFHEGALTKADYTFLVNVKMETATDYNYIISKPSELLRKINIYAFENKYVFNQILIDELLVNDEYEDKREVLFAQLKKENEDTIDFIKHMYDNTTHLNKFMAELCGHWHSIWRHISNSEIFTDDQRFSYLESIIKYADLSDIIRIFEKQDPAISYCSWFLNIEASQAKIEKIIVALDVRFTNLSVDSNKDLLSFIRKSKHYAISIDMLRLMMSDLEGYDEHKFNTQNYTHIYELNNSDIIEYIEDSINFYTESMYLELEHNTSEAQRSIITLLNNEHIDYESKLLIIDKTQTIIDEISDVDDIDICDLLYDYSKIVATWDNILDVFNRNESTLTKSVIDFMNISRNAEILSSQRMTTDKDENDIAIYLKLCWAIIYESKLSKETYTILLNSIPWSFSSLKVERIDADRVQILIENNKISTTVEMLHYLRDNFAPLNMMHLEKQFNKYKDLIQEIELSGSDIKLMLESKVIDVESKFKFIEYSDENLIISSKSNITLVMSLLVTYPEYPISSTLKKEIALSKYISQNNKIDMFNNNISLFSDDDLDILMETLGGYYAVIADKKSHPVFADTPRHQYFLENLKQLRYINSYSEDKKGLRVYHSSGIRSTDDA
ncbi:MAG: hypothetical protein SNH01_04710 [Rikenellaceae bacterium]